MEHHVIKIPMTDEIYAELDDAFIDKKETAHDFVWGLIRKICKDAKLGKLNKICAVNVIENGQQKTEQIKLKETKLEDVNSDSKWLPENLDKDEVVYFEHKITDKTMEYLKLFSSFTILRHEKFTGSLEKANSEKLEKMSSDKKTTEATISDAKETFEKQLQKMYDAIPSCLEEVVYNAIYPAIQKEVADNIDISLDKENEEMYPKEDPKKTSK